MSSVRIPFYRHDLGQAELDAIAECLRGPILTTGEIVAQFEERFADFLGVRHCLGLTSCTGALHLSLLALGIGPGDEVITTPMTFIATVTAILQAGATPVLVDVDAATGLIDPERVEAAVTKRTRAVIPVHLYGQMCDMHSLREIAQRHGIHIIEDSAHCIEGMRDGYHPGNLGTTACFSFYATKNMTCGEGGAIVTNDDSLAAKLRLLRLHGMTKTAADRAREGYTHWDMTVLGWKYNMDNLQASLLLPQLARLQETWKRRAALARYYQQRLAEISFVQCPVTLADVKHAHHLFPVWVNDCLRDDLIRHLHAHGIDVVVNYRALHLLSYFQQQFGFCHGDFPEAERIGAATISLPFFPSMGLEAVDEVVDSLRQFCHANRLVA